ncbi:MAG: TolC family protein [Deltaproteobacteria bacterium]|nr:TolC family protein [Deltaproteobacteria bacterium]
MTTKHKYLAPLFIFIVLILFSARSFADSQVLTLSLDDCIRYALNNNEDIKMAHYDVVGSIAQKIEATKRYVPVVKYQYRIAPVPKDVNNPAQSFFSGDISVFNSFKIEAGIPVTTFGRLAISKELADIGIDASRLQKQRKADEILLDVYKLYHGILLADELSILAQKGLDAISDKIGELEREENADQLQILKLKAVLYQVEKKADEAYKKGTIAKAMLKYRLGLEDDVVLLLKNKTLNKEHFPYRSYEDLLKQAKNSRAEFKLLQKQVWAKDKQLQLEKREYYPKLILGSFIDYGVSPGIIGDEDDSAFNNPFNFTRAGVGFELAGELDFRKIKSKVEKAKAEKYKAIAEKRSKHRLLEIDMKNSFLELEQRRKLLMRAEQEKKSARQVVFLTKSNLDIGLGEKKDYLEAVQSYLLIQAALYENIFNYNTAVAKIKSQIGTLYDVNQL